MTDPMPQRVGRLAFAGEPFRVSRGVDEVVGERRYPGSIAVLIGLLGLLLLLFAIRVRSGPAIGSVSMALIALSWLVWRARKPRRSGEETLTVGSDQLTVSGPTREAAVDLADVTDIGTGSDGSLRTVWARTETDRVLLFDALTEEEAEALRAELRARVLS